MVWADQWSQSLVGPMSLATSQRHGDYRRRIISNTSLSNDGTPNPASLLAKWVSGMTVDLTSLNDWADIATLILGRDRWGDRETTLLLLQIDPTLDAATLEKIDAVIAALEPIADTYNPEPTASSCTSASIVDPKINTLVANIHDWFKATTCVWRKTRSGKLAFQAELPREIAKVDNTGHWGPLEASLTAYNRFHGTKFAFDGIGFLLTADGHNLVVIDIDSCLDPSTRVIIRPEIQRYLDSLLPTYCEVSQSGKGLHLFVRVNPEVYAVLVKSGKRYAGIEIYATRRFIALTGDLYPSGRPDGSRESSEIVDRTTEVAGILNEIAASRTKTKRSKPASNKPKPSDRSVGDPLPADPHQIDLEDLDITPDTYIKQLTRKDLLAKARTAKQMGTQFINHYDLGELRSGDPSATDYWIINNLTYWFRGDPVEIQRAFINSPYYRINNREEKWYSPRGDSTYGANMINLALTECKTFYDPNYRPSRVNKHLESFTRFLAECCTTNPSDRCSLEELHATYQNHCGVSISLQSFGILLSQHQFRQVRSYRTRTYLGLGLKSSSS